MIRRLLIHRFRGIREGKLEDLGKINLLIGPNNSGKTAILEMLYLSGTSGREVEIVSKDFIEPEKSEKSEKENGNQEKDKKIADKITTSLKKDFLNHNPLLRLRKRHEYPLTTFKGYHAARDSANNLLFEIEQLSNDAPIKQFQISLTLPPYGLGGFDAEDEYAVGLFSLYNPSKYPIKLPRFLTKIKFENSTQWNFMWDSLWVHRHPPFEEEEIIGKEGKKKKTMDSNFISIWVVEGNFPYTRHVLFLDFHVATEPFMNSFAQEMYMKLPDWERKIEESLGRVFPELNGCRISIHPGPYGEVWTGYVQEKGKYPVEIAQYGDGARHAFKVLASLIALSEMVDEEHPGLFLWEDPELFMHPATLGRILDEIVNITWRKPIQVFITTQSLEVITWMAHYLDRLSDEETEKVRSFRLGLENGKLKVHKFEGRGISGWLHFFGDPRFIGEDEKLSPLFHLIGGKEL